MIAQGIFEPVGTAAGALSESECRRLLATRTLGRVGFTSRALPVIMPVEYVYDQGVVVFRTEREDKLRAAIHGAVLAFEVDAFDPLTGFGWSVLVRGRATVLTAEPELAPLPMLENSSDESRRHRVRLHCEIVSGRRLVASES